MQPSLFDIHEGLSITPSPERPDPVIWIERMIVVESLSEDTEIIREISFRRGLNIIRTEKRLPTDKKSIGHDVGKTLLTRLIRYLLGEPFYAKADVRQALYYRLKDAYVIGRIFINGISWIVARPIGHWDTLKPFAFQGETWQDALTIENRPKFSLYTATIAEATLTNLPISPLLGANKRSRWLDILAWVTRDQKCGLRKITEWRHPETESGTAQIQQQEANQLIRMVMDILDSEEQEAIANHKKLLRKRKEIIASISLLRSDMNALHLLLFDELRSGSNEDGKLFISKERDAVEQKIANLKRLRHDYDNAFPEKEEKEYRSKKTAYDELEGKRQQAEAEKLHIEGLLSQRQASADKGPFGTLAEICPDPLCKLKEKLAKTIDVEKEEKIKEIRLEITRLSEILCEIQEQQVDRKRDYIDIRSIYSRKKREFQKKIDGINGFIGRLSIQKNHFEKYESQLDREFDLTKSLESYTEQIDKSRIVQKRIQEEYGRRKYKHEGILGLVTRQLMNENDSPKLVLDGNGLKILMNEKITGSGEASGSGIVLSLDWAACVASICGLGYHPRFLIHDSPREADREQEAYHQLFLFARELDAIFTNTPPSFQYIVTTTTQPPDGVTCDPFIRETLHSRNDDGLLLRKTF